ncbi:Gfo/Idh/MocA family protein [Fictibacillus terranigra]|uniref:Gfo/Idh/MocA family oxidoreductase n=1 Tax=Fictibacillus terranigra TaxID=3058424 RepID=A0ABT8E9D2_9BACL|nr:Gfo/Idh/MocA family oxidoreductase [Fictibacillus sp. CENA-BCM004]MDN4074497.1 Gfo/Idh/MocA family oxidoreductase [Fictibacillus sp. CENA-BCM004]
MPKKIRIGIIGCGGIANGKHMPSLSKIDEVELAAFCDLEEEKARKAAQEFGTPDAKVFTDYKELLEDKSLNVVHVCTPNDSHADITVDALEADKHVMCEKPMAKTVKDARRMVDTAKRTGKKLTIGYQYRYRADSWHLHKLCERGDFGEIYYAKAHAIRRRAVPTWGVFLDEEKQGGGSLIDIGTHSLDMTLWMMNNYEPKAVLGTTFHKLGKKKDAANAWGSWDPDKFTVEDSAFGMITMKNGATISLETSWALNTLQTGEAMCTLCGTEGGADMMDGLRINGEDFGKLYSNKIQVDGKGVAFYDADEESDADHEARLWVDALLNDKEPVVKPEQALVVTEILEAIYESAKTGKAVYFDEEEKDLDPSVQTDKILQ